MLGVKNTRFIHFVAGAQSPSSSHLGQRRPSPPLRSELGGDTTPSPAGRARAHPLVAWPGLFRHPHSVHTSGNHAPSCRPPSACPRRGVLRRPMVSGQRGRASRCCARICAGRGSASLPLLSSLSAGGELAEPRVAVVASHARQSLRARLGPPERRHLLRWCPCFLATVSSSRFKSVFGATARQAVFSLARHSETVRGRSRANTALYPR